MSKIWAILLSFIVLFIFFNLKEHPKEVTNNQSRDVHEKLKNLPVPNHEEKSDEWKLVFHDDFNQSKIDSTRWKAINRKKNYNNELQAYTSKNVRIRNGRLYLTGLKEGGAYSSGLVQTNGKFDFLYGKVEVKARYPSGKGLFPAIWLLRSDGKDHLPEIDIFEAVGHEPDKAYMVQHWRDNGKLKTVYGTKIIPNYQEEHLFGVEWERTEIRWYIDNQLVFKAKNHEANLPMYLIINLAIGGNWPGSPNNETEFPAEFSIDYVKIYEREKSHD